MNEHDLKELLTNVANNSIEIDNAINEIKRSVFQTENLEFANIDYHRELRHGLSEVIYGEGKTTEQISQIAKKLTENDKCVLITRIDQNKINEIGDQFEDTRGNSVAKTLIINPPPIIEVTPSIPSLAIITAGTCDIPVAEEAAEVCVAVQLPHQKVYDVGVAGLHRILNQLPKLEKADMAIVVAGMEGALPSVFGGIVGYPVIAVPTSVGYGANFNGLSALLGMLNSCASGITVTNIDAGFSAGFAAARILNRIKMRCG